jgi:glycosyltransferase involved in cell wall biosynthesis
MSDPLVSIVITNFNYREFLPTAIRSALDQTHGRVEVIVVDDGSTDGSRSVIAEFGDRVTPIYQENQGQTSATNRGFAAASGEIVMFLDADDALHRQAVAEVVARWRPGVSKVQFCLSTVDDHGRSVGYVFPRFPDDYSPERVRRSVLRTGTYVWVNTSGNAYGRAYLERIMPMSAERFPHSIDGPLNTVAPLFVDVISISRALGHYRVHGRNIRAMRRFDPSRLASWIVGRGRELAYFQEWAAKLGVDVAENALDEPVVLEYRIASLRLDPGHHPQRDDTVAGLLSLAARKILRSDDQLYRRVMRLQCAVLMALAPLPIARWIATIYFVPTSRPPALQKLLRCVRLVQTKGNERDDLSYLS